jgi:hypothetical protein
MAQNCQANLNKEGHNKGSLWNLVLNCNSYDAVSTMFEREVARVVGRKVEREVGREVERES